MGTLKKLHFYLNSKKISFNDIIEGKKFYVSVQAQLSRSIENAADDFFFSWSEAGYNLSATIFGGVALQYTRQQHTKLPEPGFVAGLNFKELSIPVYLFNPFKTNRYFVVGLNYCFNVKKMPASPGK